MEVVQYLFAVPPSPRPALGVTFCVLEWKPLLNFFRLSLKVVDFPGIFGFGRHWNAKLLSGISSNLAEPGGRKRFEPCGTNLYSGSQFEGLRAFFARGI